MGRTERLQEPREAGLIGGDVGAEGGGEDHGESISSGNILFTFNDSLPKLAAPHYDGEESSFTAADNVLI